MATQANVVVKKTDGTTDVTFTGVQGATADEPAIWQNTASSTIYSNRDSFKFRSRDNGTKTARWMEIDAAFVVRRTESSLEVNKGVIPAKFAIPLPNWATDAEINEAVDQFINLLASLHIRTHIKGRYAPN